MAASGRESRYFRRRAAAVSASALSSGIDNILLTRFLTCVISVGVTDRSGKKFGNRNRGNEKCHACSLLLKDTFNDRMISFEICDEDVRIKRHKARVLDNTLPFQSSVPFLAELSLVFDPIGELTFQCTGGIGKALGQRMPNLPDFSEFYDGRFHTRSLYTIGV
jgi:hypothetical protein